MSVPIPQTNSPAIIHNEQNHSRKAHLEDKAKFAQALEDVKKVQHQNLYEEKLIRNIDDVKKIKQIYGEEEVGTKIALKQVANEIAIMLFETMLKKPEADDEEGSFSKEMWEKEFVNKVANKMAPQSQIAKQIYDKLKE